MDGFLSSYDTRFVRKNTKVGTRRVRRNYIGWDASRADEIRRSGSMACDRFVCAQNGKLKTLKLKKYN